MYASITRASASGAVKIPTRRAFCTQADVTLPYVDRRVERRGRRLFLGKDLVKPNLRFLRYSQSLQDFSPELAAQWHPHKNCGITPVG